MVGMSWWLRKVVRRDADWSILAETPVGWRRFNAWIYETKGIKRRAAIYKTVRRLTREVRNILGCPLGRNVLPSFSHLFRRNVQSIHIHCQVLKVRYLGKERTGFNIRSREGATQIIVNAGALPFGQEPRCRTHPSHQKYST